MRGGLILSLIILGLLLIITPVKADDCPCNTSGSCDVMMDGSGNPCPCDTDCGGDPIDSCPCGDGSNNNCPPAPDGGSCLCDPDCSSQTSQCPTEEMKQEERNRCIASGGTPYDNTGSDGCVYVQCNQCPDETQKEFFRNECLQNGGSPYEVINNGCVYIECEGETQDDCPCADGANNNCPLSPMGTDCLCDPDCGSENDMCPCDTQSGVCNIMLDGSGQQCPCDLDCDSTTTCLSEIELKNKEDNCLQTGGRTVRVTIGNCVDVECQYNQTSTQCPTEEMKKQERDRCIASGGTPYDNTGSDGCVYVQCNQCPSDEEKEFFRNECLQTGGSPYEKLVNGCIFIECDGGQDDNMCPCADGANNNCPKSLMGDTYCCCDPDCNSKPECMMISTQCPTEEMKTIERNKCISNGGTPTDKISPNGCTFISCDYVPQGCTKVINSKGMETIQCTPINQTQCPPDSLLTEKKIRCADNGGIPEIYRDPMGCNYINCRFDNQTNFLARKECPNETEVTNALRKCENLGLIGKIAFENGCKIAKCVEEKETYCPEEMDPSIKQNIISECQASNGRVVTGFDEKGCPITKCETQDYCLTVPREAISECEKYGGQMITKTDDTGCVTYFKCLQRGETSSSYVAPITEVPSSTKLLQVSIALETLIMKLDELSRNTEGIANYYASIGSSEELRFRTVAGMFKGVITKVQLIKQGIKDNLANMTTNYLEKVKSDIQYIKDVVLMDIVYVMLSTGDDFTIPEVGDELTCDTEQCFNDAYRICKPVNYYSESDELQFSIQGMDNDTCVVKVSKPSTGDEMTCKRSDYAFGLHIEDELSTYCEGSLVSVLS